MGAVICLADMRNPVPARPYAIIDGKVPGAESGLPGGM
jgi:hypothetical protein